MRLLEAGCGHKIRGSDVQSLVPRFSAFIQRVKNLLSGLTGLLLVSGDVPLVDYYP